MATTSTSTAETAVISVHDGVRFCAREGISCSFATTASLAVHRPSRARDSTDKRSGLRLQEIREQSYHQPLVPRLGPRAAAGRRQTTSGCSRQIAQERLWTSGAGPQRLKLPLVGPLLPGGV